MSTFLARHPTQHNVRPLSAAALLVVASLLAACGGLHSSAVQSDGAALGRVVIYRNGVAYYERRATVEDGKLTIAVPSDKIDDFLKSMTITDLATGQPLPVAFPAPGHRPTRQPGVTELVVTVPPVDGVRRDKREVLLTYVTEAAAWKPSYRVVLQQDERGQTHGVELQGWAVVDNTSAEDWNAVRVGVGSSSALAFRYDLRSIRHVQRQTLHGEATFVRAPPRGGAVGTERGEPAERELAAVDDKDIARNEGHPDVAEAPASVDKTSSSEGAGARAGVARAGRPAAPVKVQQQAYRSYSIKALAKADAKKNDAEEPRDARDAQVDALADRLRRTGEAVRVEGYAASNEPDFGDRSRDRAHLLRNQLIERGVPPAQVAAVGKGVQSGRSAGVRIVALPTPPAGESGQVSQADAPPVGESHFESRMAMTVARGSSAMVSILKSKTKGDIVYLYAPEGRGGDGRYAFRAVRFVNPTNYTLDPGPMTVYGAGRFIGEGMADPIPPGRSAVVPYALDRQVTVERDADAGEEIARLLKLSRGVLTAEVQHLRRHSYRIANRSHEKVTVLVRHETSQGWTLQKGPDTLERFGTARLYAVDVAPGSVQTLALVEATPLQRTIDLRSPVGLDMVRLHLVNIAKDAELQAAMSRVMQHHEASAKAEEKIALLRERVAELRVRLDELHGQLASLEGMARGASLEAHLQKKMRETSEAVQKTTMAIVEAQQERMLARVRFQDELSELTLAKVAERAAAPAPAVATAGPRS